jgi:hypothetical protein
MTIQLCNPSHASFPQDHLWELISKVTDKSRINVTLHDARWSKIRDHSPVSARLYSGV